MTDSPLPVLPFWQARSFWLTLLATLSSVLVVLQGIFPSLAPTLAGVLPLVQDPATVEAIMGLVAGVAGVLAWFQRLKPRYQLGA